MIESRDSLFRMQYEIKVWNVLDTTPIAIGATRTDMRFLFRFKFYAVSHHYCQVDCFYSAKAIEKCIETHHVFTLG